MTSNELRDQFWLSYCLLEDEFKETIPFVTVAKDNYNTYSTAYAKLLLEIGSETDIALKNYCIIIDPSFSGSSINQYRDCIINNKRSMCNQEVQIINRNITFIPWSTWSEPTEPSPLWWKVYNKVKHERNSVGSIASITKEYYKFANLEYTLNALAGLYVVLMYTYIDLTAKEGAKEISPRPLSRLFDLLGGAWNNVKFKSGEQFLYTSSGEIIYDRHAFF